MAQTDFTPIQIYSSSTTGNTPAAGNLLNSSAGSELAINIFDGKLFYKDNTGAVQVIGWKVVPVSAGGTGQTSYTDGQLLIGNSTGNTLTKATLTAGSGVSITNGAGAITISATGGTGTVTSITAGTGLTGGTITTSGTIAIDSTVTTLTGTQTLTNKTLTAPKVDLINDTNGNESLVFSPTTSATDYFVMKNGIGVGAPLHIYADGSSANTGMHIQPKGTGLVTISDGTDFNKGIRFRSSGSAASAVTLLDAVSSAGRVVTLPDATTTLVGRDTTDTLTNKSISGSTNTLSNISNASLTNSTISGVALGGSLFNLTAGTGVSFSAGTTYNGSAAITINATGTGGTVTSVTGTAPVAVATGTTTPVISMAKATTSVDGYLSSTDWTTFNNKSNTNGTVTSVAALTLGTSGTDLSSTVANGTTTPVITLNVPTASATNRGALSAADWTTFNNKTSNAGTVTSVAASVPAFLSISGSPITTSGTLAITLSGTALPVANGGTGSTTAFTTGSVVFAGASGVYTQNNSSFFWDNTNNRLGIGTTSPATRLETSVSNPTRGIISQFTNSAGSGQTGAQITFNQTGVDTWTFGMPAGASAISFWNSRSPTVDGTVQMSINNLGNFSITGATAIKASGTTWANPSDVRLKDNVTNYTKGLAELMQVNVKEWVYNGKGGTTEGIKGLGVIADEIMEVLPNTVDIYKAKLDADDEADTDIKKFDATEITWLMLNAIKEQQALIVNLTARLDAITATYLAQ